MVDLHPLARVLATLLISVAAFIVQRPAGMLVVYGVVFLGVVATGITRSHLRFVAFVTGPLLAALLVVWGLLVAPPESAHVNGVGYAVATWLRIAALGGAFQCLLLPLAERPLHLRAFLASFRVSATVGTLLVTPILFLPEVRRRIDRISDARKAQGLPTRGLSGLAALPNMMTPLVSSLLESALARAELWTHRGLLERNGESWAMTRYAPATSWAVVLTGIVTLAAAVGRWI